MASANIKQVRNLAGELIVASPSGGPFKSAGHMDSFSTLVTPTVEPIYSAIGGKRRQYDTDTVEETVTGTAVLRETGVSQLAMAFLSEEQSLTQAALTGENRAGAAEAGDFVYLGALDVTITSITDGVDALVEGTDYELDAPNGLVKFLQDTAYDITFNSAEILASAGRSVISALSATNGIERKVKLIQRQTRGNSRFTWTGLVRFYPNGEAVLHNDAGDKITVPVRFDVIEDTSEPEGRRYGYLEEHKIA